MEDSVDMKITFMKEKVSAIKKRNGKHNATRGPHEDPRTSTKSEGKHRTESLLCFIGGVNEAE